MATFADDFNRADGAPGGNWVVVTGSYSIAAHLLDVVSVGQIVNTTVGGGGRIDISCDVYSAINTSTYAGPCIKAETGVRSGFTTGYLTVSGTHYFQIRYWSGSSFVVLVETALAEAPPPFSHIYLEWEDGHLLAVLNGETTLEADSVLFAGNSYAGMYATNTAAYFDNVFITGGQAVALSISPEAVGNYGQCTELTLTGTNTAWTPGTPGSPTFTVDHGTISAQTVNSATEAVVTYCPGDFLGTATFTDPSTGASDTVLVTSDPEIVPPGDLCPFNDDFIDMANDTGTTYTPGHLLTDAHLVILSPTMNIQDALAYLITLVRDLYLPGEGGGDAAGLLENLRKAVQGAWTPDDMILFPAHEQPVKADTDAILSFLEADPNNFTSLADIVELLGGSPTVLSHQDLKTAIDNIQADVDLQPVLDAIAALRGSQVISLTDIAGLINLLTLNSSYNLGDVLTAIANLNPATAPGLAAALATIMGSLGALALEIAAIGVAETGDAAASSAGAASAAAALAWLLANGPIITGLLNDIKELLTPSGFVAPQPPVWPGLANVDLGDPVDLASTNTLAGPMHGVLLDITSADPGTNRYVYDTMPAWKNIGALSFFTDTGHHETYQALSFAQALYVPKTMAVAGGVRLFHGRGPEGTITPWSFKT